MNLALQLKCPCLKLLSILALAATPLLSSVATGMPAFAAIGGSAPWQSLETTRVAALGDLAPSRQDGELPVADPQVAPMREKAEGAGEDILDLLIPLIPVFAKNAGPVATLQATCVVPCADSAAIDLVATATSRYSTVAQVEFFRDGVSIGTKTSAPFTLSVAGVLPGTYRFSVVATDVRGKRGGEVSASVAVRANAAPVVSSLSASCLPVGCNAPANVTLTATASDADGDGLARVEFYDVSAGLNSATKVGQATAAPYSFTHSRGVGLYLYRAVAVDGLGKASTLASSPEVSVQVNNLRPIVSNLAASCSGSCVASPGVPAQVTLSASVNDASPGAGVTLYFYLGAGPTPVAQCAAGGGACSVAWAAGAGSHDIYADAVDGYGGRSDRAGPLHINVAANNPPTISSVTPAQAQVALGGAVSFVVAASDTDPGDSISSVALVSGSVQLASGTLTAPGVYTVTWQPGSEGTFSDLRVRATDSLGAFTLSQALEVKAVAAAASVTPNSTVAGVPSPYPTPNVGTIAASFAVTDSGAATYSIPIQVPPGTAGMHPKLSLNYSSQGGYGHLGVGWTLSGLSTITRCAKTEAQDNGVKASINYDGDANNDDYCLDGQRLVRVGPFGWTGVEYRTEVESYSRIVAYSETGDLVGPNRFRVWTKTGQIMDFGSRWWALSRGWDQNASYNGSQQTRVNAAKMWLLDRLEDAAGNFMEIDYSDLARADFPTEPGMWRNLLDQRGVCPDAPAPETGERPIGAYPNLEVWPEVIRYYAKGTPGNGCGSVPHNQVRFFYENMTNNADWKQRERFYDPGAGQSSVTKRLIGIQTSVDAYGRDGVGTIVKYYQLAYADSNQTKRTLLRSITECAADGTCLPATTFDWASDSWLSAGQRFASTWTELSLPFSTRTEIKVGDLNGDGKSDLLGWKIYPVVGSDWDYHHELWACYGTGTGFNCDAAPVIARVARLQEPEAQLLDVDNDGRADVLIGFMGTFPEVKLCQGTSSGLNCTNPSFPPGNWQTSQVPSEYYPSYRGDFDGDGRPDVAFYTGNGTYEVNLTRGDGFHVGQRITFSVPHPTCNLAGDDPVRCEEMDPNVYQHNVLVADVNGDGKADLVIRRGTTEGNPNYPAAWAQDWKVCFADFGEGTSNTFKCHNRFNAGLNAPPHKTTVFDFNGDGLADLAAESTPNKWKVCLATGDGAFEFFDPYIKWSPDLAAYVDSINNPINYYQATRCRDWNSPGASESAVYGDFNGDGRTDIASWSVSGTPHWLVCLSTGIDFDCQAWGGAAGPGDNSFTKKLQAADFDGDGKTDLLWWDNIADPPVAKMLKTLGPKGSDLITKITTGLTATTSIEFKPLTDASVYNRGNDSDRAERELNIQSPMFVVSRTDASDGIGGLSPTTYYYEGLRGRTDGRGLYGFAKRRMRDASGMVTEIDYRRVSAAEYAANWPIVGQPAEIRTYAPLDTLPSYGVGYQKGITPSAAAASDSNLRLVSRSTNTPAVRRSLTCNGAQCSGSPLVLEVLPGTSTSESWDLSSGSALPTGTTSTTLDSYGNVTQTQVSSTDGFSKTTTNTYLAADSANWVLGRVSVASVQSCSPAVGTSGTQCSTRNASFTYHGYGGVTCSGPRGSLCSETVEPAYEFAAAPDRFLWQKTSYSYDAFGNRNQSTLQFWDRLPTGDVKVTRGATTQYEPTRGRFPVSVSNALNQTETRIFDPRFGAVLSQTGPNGISTNRLFDGFGREYLVTTLGPDNAVLSQSYSTVEWRNAAQGTSRRVAISSTGEASQADLDSLQRETAAKSKAFNDNTWASASTVYDSYGRRASTTKPAGTGAVTASFQYDALGRLRQELQTGSGVSLQSNLGYGVFDDSGTPRAVATSTVSGTGLLSRSTAKRSNSQGQTLAVIDAAGGTTRFAYDAQGNLLTVTGPTAIKEQMSYDLRGRKRSLSNPDSGSWSYLYNGAGELIEQTDAKSQITRQYYDALGRQIERREHPSTGTPFVTVWSYDTYADGSACNMGIGKLCETRSATVERGNALGGALEIVGSVTGANHSVRRLSRYDAYGRADQGITEVREPSATVGAPLLRRWSAASSFDAHSRVLRQVYPSGYTLDHSYSAWSGRLKQVAEWVNGSIGQVHWLANSRNLDGQIASMTLGSGISVSKGYDGFGRISSINAAGGVLQNGSYSFDALGNLTSRSDVVNGQAAHSYGYDLLNRLVTQGSDTIASYDAAGNILSRSGVAGYVYNYGANNNHQVTSAGGYSLTYDANGNVTGIAGNGANKTLAYLPFNLPRQITAEGNTLSYLYDGAHGRIKETVQVGTAISSTYYLGGFEVHTRSDGVVEERHYLTGAEGAIGIHTRRSNAQNDTRYWFKDHLGSIVAISDAGGAAKQRFSYDAWGKRSTSFNADPSAEERGYTGHEHLVEAGLIHMNGRLYFDPLGRMLQADPIIQSPYDGQNYNRYSYVLNNPLAFTDPTGYSWWTKWRRSVAAIVAAVFMQYYLMPHLLAGLELTSEVAGFISSVASGFAAGGIQGGNIESALTGAMFAGAFYGVGELSGAHANAAKPDFFLSPSHVGQVVGHAVLGCTQAVMAGGSCKAGAMGAGFAAAVGPMLPGEIREAKNLAARTVAGAIGARLGGGNAMIGAFEAVFAYLANDFATENSVDGSTITVEVGDYPKTAGEAWFGFAKFSEPVLGISSLSVCAAEGCSGLEWGLALGAVTPVGRVAKGAKGVGTTAEQILNAERIGSGLKADASHRAASFLSKEQLQAGQVFPLRGGDGVERTLLQTPGGLNGKNGIYEYIYDSAGKVTHQRFIEGGTVTGLPNQRVPKVP